MLMPCNFFKVLYVPLVWGWGGPETNLLLLQWIMCAQTLPMIAFVIILLCSYGE